MIDLAEGKGFEPLVSLDGIRRFSKPLHTSRVCGTKGHKSAKISRILYECEGQMRRELRPLVAQKVTHETPRLLTPDAILVKAVPADPIMCGIYFLIRDGQITYAGQSVHIMARIASHMAFKRFDSWAWTPCDRSDLNALERAYIDALAPEENVDSRTRRLQWEAAPRKRVPFLRLNGRSVRPIWTRSITARPRPSMRRCAITCGDCGRCDAQGNQP